jgi:hypothetical protein
MGTDKGRAQAWKQVVIPGWGGGFYTTAISDCAGPAEAGGFFH